ncbi:uncharacterized protein EMH_0067100 [Eimeria mitis]|uniref:Glutaredoxin domain-containing protein n=1 Tax=Eimeria mitis TaxID=44415 RepID=U6K564_9EIME|nr:uncharacterized protein EMH_0067100 [Eimeria mitis]CDJ31477.1 hypothetical protein, conserved [Eimeria mitis]
MSRRSTIFASGGVHSLLLLAYLVIFLNVKCSEGAAVNNSDGGLVEAQVQDEMHKLDTEVTPPAIQPPDGNAQASPEMHSAEGDAYLLQNREQQPIQGRGTPHPSTSGILGRVVTMGLLASVVVLMGLVSWEVMNFVGDVPDPFKDVKDPTLIPVMIEDMLAGGKSIAFVVSRSGGKEDMLPDPFKDVKDPTLIPVMIEDMLAAGRSIAFVVRRCKYCGIGIRALKRAGKDTVVVMVEGHPHQGVISRHLRNRQTLQVLRHRDSGTEKGREGYGHPHQSVISRHLRNKYGARGFPFFIIDGDRFGYLTKIKQYLADESPR